LLRVGPGNEGGVSRLRRVDCAEPGYSRRRRGRGFSYHGATGALLRDPAAIERIRALAIPPAWTDVWICRHANGHLQAVGTDSAGRRQYLYHAVWREQRDREKFENMLAFARALPGLREESSRLLRKRGLGKDRVLGFAATLLDRGLFRVGSEQYTDDNGSYGLTTLERRHVLLHRGGELVFDYVGKTGARQVHTVVDRRLHSIAGELKDRPNRQKAFLAFENGSGWSELSATDVNAFIKEHTGGDFSAKDFRTWHGTVHAAASLARSHEADTAAGRTRAVNQAAADVAELLGNTPAVSKSSYIDPRVFDLYRSGITISSRAAAPALNGSGPRQQEARERAVLRLLGQR
jgi:DNA topoisomerase I